jgi:signal transduction histidine kinase
MRVELHQEYAMTSNTPTSPTSGLPDTAALLRALAAAPDWASLCAILARSLEVAMPSARLDIYTAGADGSLTLRFTNGPDLADSVRVADAEIQLRRQLLRQGYDAVMIVPLVGAEQRHGWLALARRQVGFPAAAHALVEQVAPLLALWLRCEQREAALAERERATDALRLRATLVAGAAHDIGNLFTTMMGYAQILQQDIPASYQDDLKMIVRAVEDGRQLLRRLQGAEAAPDAASANTTTVAQAIHDVVRLTRPLWERRRGVSVQIALEENARVRIPAEDLREVLVNLMLNAVAAISEGGVITIGGGVRAGRAYVSVTDTGHGIARERHSAIFQPFVTSRAGGSGLGLSVSRSLIEGYGGELTVESEPGSGATFTVLLPPA